MKKKIKSKFAAKQTLVAKLQKLKNQKVSKANQSEISLNQLENVLPEIKVKPKIKRISKQAEITKFKAIRTLDEFKNNPFLSIQTHLRNTLAESDCHPKD
jgi:Tfp pilus assembly protein PilO